MNIIPLKFVKVGNHWLPDIPCSHIKDLQLDHRIERYINALDRFNDGVVNRIYLIEQNSIIYPEGLIQFQDKDITRYFTTNDEFIMSLYINNQKFLITSNLYHLFDSHYDLNLHQNVYRLGII